MLDIIKLQKNKLAVAHVNLRFIKNCTLQKE